MIIILTSSRYFYKNYCIKRGIPIENAIYVNDYYGLQGHPRDTKVILTNGAQRLNPSIIQKARELFDSVKRDYIL